MPPFRSRPDGSPYPITPRRGSAGLLAAALLTAVLVGGGELGAGGMGAGASGAGTGALPGNLDGTVADALPGRDLLTRRNQARSSARAGRGSEAWSRFGLKQLTRRAEHAAIRELDCVAAATGQVREYLLRTPCTSLDRILLTVGDGHGNAAVVSVVRIGFRATAQARAFQKVEDSPGVGDVRPLDVVAVLHLTGVTLTAQHYHSRLDGHAVVAAEADTAAGHVTGDQLDAIADVASYLPLT